jgi:pyrroline-5-carboxylate reductase
MRKTGFIGFGAMGSIMLKALLDAGTLSQEQVVVFTRTPEKIDDFNKKYPKVEIAKSLAELASECERIFVCTGTAEVKGVLSELVNYMPKDVHLITITGTIEIKCLETIYTGKISKIIPTQIAEIGEGVTLVYHNKKVPLADKNFIHAAFGKIGQVKEMKESQLGLADELSGCAPAFYAAILNNFVEAVKKHGDLTLEEIQEIMVVTFYGTAKLFIDRKVGFTELITRVATPGGITEEGVKILDRELPAMFDEMLTVTLNKREKIKRRMREQYGID